MPIWLRRFTLQQIIEYQKAEKAAYEKASSAGKNKQSAIGPDGKVNPQAFKRPTKSSYK
jgi:hypothetical protein